MIKYTCSQCGEYHESWPALGMSEPWHYHVLSLQEKEQLAKLNSDFCEIRWKGQTDRFIRTILTIPVSDHKFDLEYGLWVSVSEKSYTGYEKNFDNEAYESGFFGWICNKIPGYEDTLQIPTDVFVKAGGDRPELKPHPNHDHALVSDFFNGIAKEEAERRIHEVLKTPT